MKEYTIDNINEFFEDLMNKPDAKFNMLRVYGAYKRECEKNKKKQEIEEQYKNVIDCCQVYIVSNDIAIIKIQPNGYLAHVNNRRRCCVWDTFEQALLGAVSIKLTGSEDATEWMWKLVGGG